MGSINDLLVYKKAFSLAMEIFETTKLFPNEEKYSLTSQIRKSSRSVCANLVEAWRRRKYPAHFASKISDADAENAETGVWTEFSYACKYISDNLLKSWYSQQKEIGKLLGDILKNPTKYI